MKKMILFTITMLCLSGCTTSNQEIVSETNNQQLEDEIIKDFNEVLGIGINSNNFPDKEFTKYIKNNIDVDNNNYLSNEEIEITKSIIISDNSNIKNLDGLNYFTKLNNLVIENVPLTNIDIVGLCELQTLQLNHIPIHFLDISNNQKLERIDISDTNIEYIDLNSSNEIFEVNISDLNNNMTLDITNCKYLKDNMYYLFDNVRGHMLDNQTIYDGFINISKINDNYINIINDNKILIHYFYFTKQISSNGYASGYDKYTYGQGKYNTENKLFSTYDEAYDYGFNGNKWFNILQHYYINGEACEMYECVSILEPCKYSYEVIVYDEQPF